MRLPGRLPPPVEKVGLEYAWALAERLGAQVDVVHVFQFPTFAVEDGAVALPPYLREDLSQRLRERLEQFVIEKAGEGSKATARVLEGVPYVEIMEAAKGQDLIVLGTHGRTGLSHLLLGSVAERVGARFRGPGADHPLGGLALMPDGTRPPFARGGFFSQTLME